ncbi:cytochrome o ubiquinol oxidase subunit IV [Pusillimonas sp. ANT_WB101]|uniref:cytochrome o ubiquinol oxidase subunit IV n=1 Tax=Pusillimonas sp. ANT_WB101 TaxID=2597356 RepID=UPI0011ED3B22|nr:cytochrome o ubiquinol oxidase subunit IV [Pusillimonas sp. ANT_WB101]KAA0892962.1 cytochrome o ubiquinol oxidase subunit IV [Pusillimonas sp. ANT_WB101]
MSTIRSAELVNAHDAVSAHNGGHHGHDEHDHHDDGHAPSTFRGYMTGFVLAVILTAIPFWLVMQGVIQSATTTALVILGLGAVQIVVHMIYFLHMNTRSEGGWTLLALIFSVIFVVIILAGSMWVMYHMNTNMMPGSHNMHGMS